MNFKEILDIFIKIVTAASMLVLAVKSIQSFLYEPKEKRFKNFFKNTLIIIALIIIVFSIGYHFGKKYVYNLKDPFIQKLVLEKNSLYNAKKELYENYKNAVDKCKRDIDSQMVSIRNLQERIYETTQEISTSQGNVRGVILYSEAGFEGFSLFLRADDYSSLHDFAFGDKAKSIRILGGLEITVWGDINFQGRYLKFRKNLTQLRNDMDQKISSMKIIRI